MQANWIIMHDIAQKMHYVNFLGHKDILTISHHHAMLTESLLCREITISLRISTKKCTFQHFHYFSTCTAKCNPPLCTYHNTSKKMPDGALLLPGRSHPRVSLKPAALSLLGQLQPFSTARTQKPSSLHMQVSINAVIA
jgi:hypothetical protein